MSIGCLVVSDKSRWWDKISGGQQSAGVVGDRGETAEGRENLRRNLLLAISAIFVPLCLACYARFALSRALLTIRRIDALVHVSRSRHLSDADVWTSERRLPLLPRKWAGTSPEVCGSTGAGCVMRLWFPERCSSGHNHLAGAVSPTLWNALAFPDTMKTQLYW